MKKKGIASALILVYVLISILIEVSCSPKHIKIDEVNSTLVPQVGVSESQELLSSYKENSVKVIEPEVLSPLRKEIEGLRYSLIPYLNSTSKLFIGIENRDYIEDFLLNPEGLYFSMSVEDWEKVVRILFTFDNKDNTLIKKNILNNASEGKIKRQYAVAGLMNLLPLRYSLEFEDDETSLQKSSIITDLENIEEKHQFLIRNAFCLGFTDLTVDSSKTFRPDEYLNRGEVVSMFYHIFSNLGLPIAENQEDVDIAHNYGEISPPEHSEEVYSIETIREEYNYYVSKIAKRGNSSDKAKLAMLKKSEEIIDIDYAFQVSNTPLSMDKWAEILKEVFGLDKEEITPYICYETDGTLPYDIAAITIFNSSKILGKDYLKNTKEKEIDDARTVIPQFDTAREINQFAQMFSSGLLEGLYQVPGFTPQRPVSSAEALLLIKRIVEDMKIK